MPYYIIAIALVPSSRADAPSERVLLMWPWLASFLGGPVVNGLINAYKTKPGAATELHVDLAAKEIEARKQVSVIVITEQWRWYTAIIRPLLALPTSSSPGR